MSIDRRRSGIWQDANSNQSIASRRDYRMNNTGIAPCGTLHGALPQHWSVPATFYALHELQKTPLK